MAEVEQSITARWDKVSMDRVIAALARVRSRMPLGREDRKVLGEYGEMLQYIRTERGRKKA